MSLLAANCPTCGAPLDLGADTTIVLCLYCHHTTRIVPADATRPTAHPTLVNHEVAADVSAQVVELVIAGESAKAMALYARAADVPLAEAEKAVRRLSDIATLRLAKHLPASARGVVIGLVLIPALGFGATYELWEGMNGSSAEVWHVIGGLVLGLFFGLLLVTYVRRVRSTIVRSWGAEGHATVLHTAVVQAGFERGRTLVVLHTSVAPFDGSAPFEDDEPLLILPEDVRKLETGNVIRVRFDRKRALVFPSSPIEVVPK
jgi:uncharacterized Zn finger protein (UPF0148 family)